MRCTGTGIPYTYIYGNIEIVLLRDEVVQFSEFGSSHQNACSPKFQLVISTTNISCNETTRLNVRKKSNHQKWWLSELTLVVSEWPAFSRIRFSADTGSLQTARCWYYYSRKRVNRWTELSFIIFSQIRVKEYPNIFKMGMALEQSNWN